jgi:predicted MFS family arabinose efflux permease
MKLKRIHHLKTSSFIIAMVVAVAIGETVGWYVSRIFDYQLSMIVIGVVSIGIMAGLVSWLYDGDGD